jgi:hypothetical protein
VRTTDPDPPPFQPLGERVVKRPEPKRQEWKPLPDNPHIVERPDGKLSTNLPLPK